MHNKGSTNANSKHYGHEIFSTFWGKQYYYPQVADGETVA